MREALTLAEELYIPIMDVASDYKVAFEAIKEGSASTYDVVIHELTSIASTGHLQLIHSLHSDDRGDSEGKRVGGCSGDRTGGSSDRAGGSGDRVCGGGGGHVVQRPMAPPEVVAGTSAENEGSKKVKKKKIKKKEDFCGFKMRFNSKWLGDLAQQLSPAKQGIIRNGLFGNLLDIKPFKVPHALIEFVVMHTNHALLEFKYKNKSIKFSKNMVKRIFNVPSGDSPMKLLKKSDEHDLCSIYKEGNRAPMANVFKLLRDYSDTDETMIRRTWALVALAIVVCPGTDNMVNLEYLPSLENMDLVHNLAWDEHLLARAMEEIIYMDHLDIPPGLPNEHVIDYSVPRIRYVCQKDFDWVDKVDKNKLTLVQPFYGKHTQFRTVCNTLYAEVIGPEVDHEAATGQGAGAEAANGQGSQNEVREAQENVEVLPNLSSSFDDWLQQPFPSMDELKVPSQFQTLYAKHKENFSTEVDDAIRKFGQSLKRLQSNRMASMLRDVGDAIANTTDEALEKAKDAQDEAATPTMDEDREKEKDAQDEAEAATPPMDEAREKEKDAQAATSCIGDQAEGTVVVTSKDEVVGEMEKNQEVAEDAGQTREQQRGYEDFNLMHGMDEPTNNNKTCSNLYPNIHVFPVSDDDGSPTILAQTMGVADELPIDVGSGPSTHDKNTRKKRMAKVPAIKPKGKKQKIEVKEDKVKAIYEKYITHAKPLRRSKPNGQPTPFIKIGEFYVGYKKFLACLKPRGDMNDEVMSLCIERLNMASYATHNRAVKKYFFSVYGASLLKQDPSIFQPNALMAELERAMAKFKLQKYDLEDIARYRMEWAYNVIHHPLNTASMELAFREELAD
ncbi:Cytokinin-O-glucosyltransferase 2 [Hordeum vulgare]|nr:Cytokinin-O-glucosyltransferase 2 [Hordeum vulgare]